MLPDGHTCKSSTYFSSPRHTQKWYHPIVLKVKLKTDCFPREEEVSLTFSACRIAGFYCNIYFFISDCFCLPFRLLAMALCGGLGAMALPSELIVHIFSFLSDRDKLRASAVCSRWRECLFYPALWTELKLRIGAGRKDGNCSSDETPKLEFLMRKFGSFVRELQLEFAPVECYIVPLNNDPSSSRMDQPHGPDNEAQLSERWRDAMAAYLDQLLCVLSSIRNNR